MARTRAAKPAAAPGSRLWLHGLICGAIVTLATPTAVLILLLLTPTLVAALFDFSPGRPVVRPVCLWGIAASVRPMMALWSGEHTMAHTLIIAGDSSVLATAWAAQAAAWLISEIVPLFVAVAMSANAAARAARLREARQVYEADWDISAPGSPE